MKRKLFGIAALLALTLLSVSAGDYSIRRLKLNHNDALYKSGEEVVVTGRLTKGGAAVTGGKLRVTVKWEGRVVETKDLPCDGKSFKITYKGEKPGWVYFSFAVVGPDGNVVENPGAKAPQGKKKLLAEIGAIYEPEKIRTKVEMPADFDEFWKGVRAKLDKVPFNTKLEKLDSGDPKIALYAVTVDAGADRPVTAYLGIPVGAKPKSHPALVNFLSWSNCDASRAHAINNAKRGFIALSATWHGFPVNQPADFYPREIRKGFRATGHIDDRDKWEFRWVYVRVLRALDYIKSRPEWDGKTLVVQGGSLAGAETATAAAFDPAVTTALISVPCFCEFSGDLAGRKRSIPVSGTNELSPAVRKALSYFDIVNLATKIKCEVYFCTGYADELCPPSNVIAAYNNLPEGTRKEFFANPNTGHYGTTYDRKAGKRLQSLFDEVKVNPYTEKY